MTDKELNKLCEFLRGCEYYIDMEYSTTKQVGMLAKRCTWRA